MKYIWLIFLTLLVKSFSFAQLQNANWCFGTNAQINFNTTPPSPSLCSNGFYPTYLNGQSASVSDNNGQILFHTNGTFILDRFNQIMPNSNGLFGGLETLQQRVIIVPKPGYPNLYYVFMLSSNYSFLPNPNASNEIGGFHYSLVDMNLNNGNGDVVVGIKNIPLKNHDGIPLHYSLNPILIASNPTFLSVESRMTSNMHNAGDKIWVSVIADYFYNNSHNRFFYNYLVSEQGINELPDGQSPIPMVNQPLDPAYYNIFLGYGVGQIKVSPNGQFLCDANSQINLYNYNNQTGNINFNSTIYNSPYTGTAYGLDFSPNSQLIYFTDNPNGLWQASLKIAPVVKKGTTIYQYFIKHKSLQLIYTYPPPVASSADIIPFNLQAPWGVQLAMDNKVYIANLIQTNTIPNISYLSAVNSPDIVGLGCNFNANEVLLSPGVIQSGFLPQWVHKAGKWPKQYTGKGAGFLTKAGNGIVAFLSTPYDFNDGGNLTPNINHLGPLPSQSITSGNNYTVHYTSTGLTNWTKTGLAPLITLHNGNIQMGGFFDNSIGAVYTYHDPITGSVVNGPSEVPAGERIIAETNNGGYITISNSNMLYLHTATGSSSGIFLNPTVSFPSLYLESYSKFNPTSNKLFIYLLVNGNPVLRIYSVTSNDISLLTEKQLPSLLGLGLYGSLIVNNSDEVFTISNNSQLVKIDYSVTNPIAVYNAVSIPGVVNSNMNPLSNIDPYTSNTCAINKHTSTGFSTYFYDLYLLDLVNYNKKTIRTTNCYANEYLLDANEVYLGVSSRFNAIYSVGNVQVNSFNSSRFMMSLFKLNLNTDFSRSANNQSILVPENSITKAITNSFSVVISPNPANNNLKVDIKVTDKANTNDTYTLIFKNTITNRSIVKKGYKSANAIDISSFEKGVHYAEIINSKGEKIDSKFIKL
jgi:hypothetical protein